MPALSYIDPKTGQKRTIGGYKSNGSVDIVEELGDSESKVISQKKVTEEVARLDNRIDSVDIAAMMPLTDVEIESATIK